MTSSNLDTLNVNNYTIGGSRILFAEQVSVGVFGEYRDLGNIVSAAIAAAIDRLDHYTSMSGARVKDRTVVRQANFSIPFSFDEPNADNLNKLFLGGTTPTVLAADTAVVIGESHVISKVRAFFLPKAITTVGLLVKDATGVITYVLGTDYFLTQVGSMVGITAMGSTILEGDTIKVTYTAAVPAGYTINPFTQTSKSGKAILQFVSQTGNNFQWAIPSTLISPDGDFSYNDQDWSQVKMRMDVQAAQGSYPYGQVSHFGVNANI